MYTVIPVVVALLRPGYSHVSQDISALGEVTAPNAIIQNTGFVVFGLLTIAFALGLHRGLPSGSKIGPVLIALSGAGVVGAGIFPCDPTCAATQQGLWSLSSLLHAFSALIASSLIPAPLIIARRLKKDDRWQSYSSYSLMTVVMSIVFFFVYFVFAFSPQAPLAPLHGLLERLFIGVLYLWIEVIALRLLRLSLRPAA